MAHRQPPLHLIILRHSLIISGEDVPTAGGARFPARGNKILSQGGDAVQITKKGGYAALESSDGQFLYYARRSPNDATGRREDAKAF
jgi:hypothetical protein